MIRSIKSLWTDPRTERGMGPVVEMLRNFYHDKQLISLLFHLCIIQKHEFKIGPTIPERIRVQSEDTSSKKLITQELLYVLIVERLLLLKRLGQDPKLILMLHQAALRPPSHNGMILIGTHVTISRIQKGWVY